MEAGAIALLLGLGAMALIESIPIDTRRAIGGLAVLVGLATILLELCGVL